MKDGDRSMQKNIQLHPNSGCHSLHMMIQAQTQPEYWMGKCSAQQLDVWHIWHYGTLTRKKQRAALICTQFSYEYKINSMLTDNALDDMF